MGTTAAIPDRRISQRTAEKYGVSLAVHQLDGGACTLRHAETSLGEDEIYLSLGLNSASNATDIREWGRVYCNHFIGREKEHVIQPLRRLVEESE